MSEDDGSTTPNLVTVVVPFHPHREVSGMLMRAINSINRQTMPVDVIAIRDEEGRGAPTTRHTGLMMVKTPWVSFLDSDDEMDPEHVAKLMETVEESGADYVYSHYRVVGGSDPRPDMLGRVWDNNDPRQTTIVTLVRTELAQSVGFFRDGMDRESLQSQGRAYAGEDWLFTLGCMEAGAKIVHRPEITWTWHHHGRNTSGIPGRGDSRP